MVTGFSLTYPRDEGITEVYNLQKYIFLQSTVGAFEPFEGPSRASTREYVSKRARNVSNVIYL